MTAFWHYTCDHGRTGIGDFGVLRPPAAQKPSLRVTALDDDERLMNDLIWCTDLPEADIEALGLTSEILSCERWTYRYLVTNPRALVPFADVQHQFTPDTQVGLLEGGARPEHWWVSWRPLAVVYSPVGVTA